MTAMFVRAFTPELEVKTRGQGGDGRTVFGIVVPYDAPVQIDAKLREQFARGAFNNQLKAAHRVPFFRGHFLDGSGGTLIGRATALRDDPLGLYGELRISNTAAGEETLELIRDGVLNEMSVGFRERQNRRLPGGVTERVTAELLEVAMVLQGAYGELASAAGVRSATAYTPNLSAATALLAALPTFDRKA